MTREGQMISIANEKLLTLPDAARVPPPGRGNTRTHPSTIYRWISRGIRGVRLESICIGGRTYTSAEALQRWADALSSRPADITSAIRTPAQRARISGCVERELKNDFGL